MPHGMLWDVPARGPEATLPASSVPAPGLASARGSVPRGTAQPQCSIGHGLGKGLCWDDVSSCVWNHRAVPGALRLLCGLFACAVPLGHQHSPS